MKVSHRSATPKLVKVTVGGPYCAGVGETACDSQIPLDVRAIRKGRKCLAQISAEIPAQTIDQRPAKGAPPGDCAAEPIPARGIGKSEGLDRFGIPMLKV